MPITYPYTPIPGESVTLKVSLEPPSHRVIAFPTQQAQEHMIYMQYAGNYIALTDYSTIRQGLPSYMINITLSGEGILEYDGKRYRLPTNHFYWIDCTPKHTFFTAPDTDRWHVLWLHLWGGNASYYYNTFRSMNAGSVVSSLPNTSPGIHIISQLMDLYENEVQEIANDIHASALLTALMADCIASTYTSGFKEPSNLITLMKEYLVSHLQEKVTLEVLSKKFFLSPFYIQRMFKEHTGASPSQYIASLRVNRGKEYLITTKMSVSEIAYAVGISNVSYFSTLFKKLEGISPQEYRTLWTPL